MQLQEHQSELTQARIQQRKAQVFQNLKNQKDSELEVKSLTQENKQLKARINELQALEIPERRETAFKYSDLVNVNQALQTENL
jgi:cell shape-determining protein MreC